MLSSWASMTSLACCLFCVSASAADYVNGKVMRVSDGDTLHVRTSEQETEKIRLFAIDCPELAQPHGRVAMGFTRSMTLGKQVTAIVHDVDAYGRSVCEVFVDGKSLNRSLLARGHAWWYERYADDDLDAKRLQQDAREQRAGLWGEDSQIPPWLWRRGVRSRSDRAVARDLLPRDEPSDDAPQLGDTLFPGLSGGELRARLRQEYTPSSTLSYRNARQAMFAEVDNYNGSVTLVYSGASFETLAIPNHTIVNTEHTWPQSRFDDGPAGPNGPRIKSDLHHLFPAYSRINAERGNKALGDIEDHLTVTWWVSPIPSVHAPVIAIRDEFSESVPDRFEPPETHKGNAARALMYIAVVYAERERNDWEWFNSQLETLRDWHRGDPADESEFERTLRIGSVQGNLNPFVVDPMLAERVFGEGLD